MLVNLDLRDARPIYLQIMDEVRRELVVGTLQPEDPLPSVRELASQLGVNPRTVSQAYGELEREGVVYVRRGQGTFVSPGSHPDEHERRAMALGVGRRALLDARRSGMDVEELVMILREMAAQQQSEPSVTDVAADQGDAE
jgi:GntR family transcriptional regulator